MVKRYVVTGDPMESPYGFWVEYGEVKGLAERCERLEVALRDILAEHANDNHRPRAFYIAAESLSGSSGGKE